MTILITLFARWGLPEWIRKPLAWATTAITLFALLWLLKGCYDRSLIRDYEAGVQEAVASSSASASAEATEAVAETKTEVEKGNAKARDAANRGTDPLGDGLRSLRADQVPPRSSSR